MSVADPDPYGLKEHIRTEMEVEDRLENLINSNLKTMEGRDKRNANEAKALSDVWLELAKRPDIYKRLND